MECENHEGENRLQTHGSTAPRDHPVKDRFKPPGKTGMVVKHRILFATESKQPDDSKNQTSPKDDEGGPQSRPGQKIVHANLVLPGVSRRLVFDPRDETTLGVNFIFYLITSRIFLNLSPSAFSSNSNKAVSRLVIWAPVFLHFSKPICLFSLVREDTASATT